MAKMSSARVGVVAMAVVAACGAAAFGYGGTGAGIAIKGGAQTMDSPIDGEETTRGRVEVEICTPMVADDHVDFALSLGGASFSTLHSEDTYTQGGVYYDDHYSDRLTLVDLRLAARLYPLGSESVIRPYFGAGVGYFWLQDYYRDHYYTTIEDSHHPGTYHTYEQKNEGDDTWADGFFPFVTAGITVPIQSHFEVLVEAQYDFNKKDSGFDLSGPIYTLGARFRF